MLIAALLPCLVLLLGTLKIVDDQVALWVALWLGVVILGVIGYLVYARRGSSIAVRLLGALSSAGFGLVMVLLKAFVH
jgi:predicted nucleic acid-binding protein